VAAFFIAHLVLETITHYNSENDYLTQETQRLVEGKNTKADVGLNCTGRVVSSHSMKNYGRPNLVRSFVANFQS
jgi:hypothetical protein